MTSYFFHQKKHALRQECSNYEGIVMQLKTEVATLKRQLSISSATITKLRDDLRSKDFMIHKKQVMLDKENGILRSLSDVCTHL